MNGKEFGEWLDEHGVDVDEAAAYFGVSSNTVYKWRSTPGIPERKLDWVRMKIAEYNAADGPAPIQNRLALTVTDQQLQSFIDASVRHQMRLTDWAIHALDEAAREGLDGPVDDLQHEPVAKKEKASSSPVRGAAPLKPRKSLELLIS